MEFFLNTEVTQQGRDIAFRSITPDFTKFSFKFTGANTVFFGEILFRIQSIFFMHNGPHSLMAHQYSVNGGKFVKLIPVLSKDGHPEARRNVNASFIRLDFTR